MIHQSIEFKLNPMNEEIISAAFRAQQETAEHFRTKARLIPWCSTQSRNELFSNQFKQKLCCLKQFFLNKPSGCIQIVYCYLAAFRLVYYFFSDYIFIRRFLGQRVFCLDEICLNKVNVLAHVSKALTQSDLLSAAIIRMSCANNIVIIK